MYSVNTVTTVTVLYVATVCNVTTLTIIIVFWQTDQQTDRHTNSQLDFLSTQAPYYKTHSFFYTVDILLDTIGEIKEKNNEMKATIKVLENELDLLQTMRNTSQKASDNHSLNYL